ncbi:helix-turn-helix domain-containing protein [Pseudomonas anguilliseptica]|uniref:Helix-turn-helix n=1 Tax=Pseudomonas anguilliseptica TaxID=53406 RepID=A0A1H5LAM6_PSEAG|nr:helix-turn-helix transcriptional regulator [Pseudomonas anguilliseptica]SEE73411.1 Helix-turn-helix [Pseudomonas anguilliseptica]
MKKYRYGIILRSARLRAGVTQAHVAELIGESQSYVSKYENGEQRLDLLELEAICVAIDVDLLDFIREYLES